MSAFYLGPRGVQQCTELSVPLMGVASNQVLPELPIRGIIELPNFNSVIDLQFIIKAFKNAWGGRSFFTLPSVPLLIIESCYKNLMAQTCSKTNSSENL